MFDVREKFISQLNKFVSLIMSSRMCSNKIRRRILNENGWRIKNNSSVMWGCVNLCRDVIIGEHSYVGHLSFFDGFGSVVIEDHVRIGSGVKFITTTHPIEKSIKRREFGNDISLKTRVGYGTWIGANVTILPGIHIGKGNVIAAGSVVTRDTEDNCMYAGIPAELKKRLPV